MEEILKNGKTARWFFWAKGLLDFVPWDGIPIK